MIFGLSITIIYIIFGAAVFLLFLMLLYIHFRPETRVLYFGESDGRLDEVKVKNESSRSLRQGPRKWFKYGRAWLTVKNGKRITSYLGKHGSAYTWRTKEGKIEKIGTLWDAIQQIWDKDFIKKIPEQEANKLKNNDIYVTVDLDSGFTPEGFEPITEDTLEQEGDVEMAKQYAEGAKAAGKQAMIPLLMALGCGGLLTMIALGLLGWLSIGKQQVIQQAIQTLVTMI